jgi:hypothetical protein
LVAAAAGRQVCAGLSVEAAGSQSSGFASGLAGRQGWFTLLTLFLLLLLTKSGQQGSVITVRSSTFSLRRAGRRGPCLQGVKQGEEKLHNAWKGGVWHTLSIETSSAVHVCGTAPLARRGAVLGVCMLLKQAYMVLLSAEGG